ncbi:MAG: efflux RND transporter permease subunit, partial [Oscillospiraceae bacterium]
NGRYLITISGQPEIGADKKLSADINEGVKALTLPRGVEVMKSMQAESMAEEFGSIINAIFTAVFLVFLVMAMQFESPIFSLVVMFCVPFSLVGSFAALLLSISLPSLMGFLMLVGTVVNNGILFIDTANQLRQQDGFTPEAALAKAGSMRLRPIFMTTLTTILAMVPMAVGMGDNAELMRGMAMVIIGGLIASTVLALLLLPSFYLAFDRMEKKNKEQRIAKEKAKKKIHME